ncbi:MAG: Type III secretion inner membrane channel protein (LcrD,HrcV,EscV,SsaV) [uncultured Paraburkholderia sp.]|nr:MAG: Type III secretion inner membrane channel protein (LcrD,HrcV,EscV,SsaV) [uncultured Paraburkholderia sp.]
MFKTLKLPAGGEVGIAMLVVAIISLMILPLPPFLIDILLAINITISVTLLMVTMYVPNVVSLSVFPSLLLSVAAGVMITRVSDERDARPLSLGDEIGRQLSASARALYFASLLLLGFAAVPGFPSSLFLLLAAILAFCGHRLGKRKPAATTHAGEAVNAMQRAGSKAETPAILTRAPQFTFPLGVRISPDLVARLSTAALDRSFETERARLQEYLGLPFPGITMWTSDALPASSCELLMHDVPYCAIELPPGKVMLPDPALTGTREPLSADAKTLAAGADARAEKRRGLDGGPGPTWWIDEKSLPPKQPAWRAEQVIAHASVAMLRKHASLFLGIQEVQWILDQQNAEYPGLVAEVQKVLPPQRIADVLRRLLEEQIPIRNVRNILESLVVWGAKGKDMLMLTEYVRGDLARFLAHRASRIARRAPGANCPRCCSICRWNSISARPSSRRRRATSSRCRPTKWGS